MELRNFNNKKLSLTLLLLSLLSIVGFLYWSHIDLLMWGKTEKGIVVSSETHISNKGLTTEVHKIQLANQELVISPFVYAELADPGDKIDVLYLSTDKSLIKLENQKYIDFYLNNSNWASPFILLAIGIFLIFLAYRFYSESSIIITQPR